MQTQIMFISVGHKISFWQTRVTCDNALKKLLLKGQCAFGLLEMSYHCFWRSEAIKSFIPSSSFYRFSKGKLWLMDIHIKEKWQEIKATQRMEMYSSQHFQHLNRRLKTIELDTIKTVIFQNMYITSFKLSQEGWRQMGVWKTKTQVNKNCLYPTTQVSQFLIIIRDTVSKDMCETVGSWFSALANIGQWPNRHCWSRRHSSAHLIVIVRGRRVWMPRLANLLHWMCI